MLPRVREDKWICELRSGRSYPTLRQHLDKQASRPRSVATSWYVCTGPEWGRSECSRDFATTQPPVVRNESNELAIALASVDKPINGTSNTVASVRETSNAYASPPPSLPMK